MCPYMPKVMLNPTGGLERILQTPIPWSYSVHLWTVTLVWLVALPFQILEPLGWLTIPGTALAAFVYCGLMKCAEELENPFGYDFNDLNLDHFCQNIVKKELQALVSLPIPDPLSWAFSFDNDAVFDQEGNAIYMVPSQQNHDVASPNEWVTRGEKDIRDGQSDAGNNPSPNAAPAPILMALSPIKATVSVPAPPAASSQASPSGSVPVPLPRHFTTYSNTMHASSRREGLAVSGAAAGSTVVEVGSWIETSTT
jgi:hypothetical protein